MYVSYVCIVCYTHVLDSIEDFNFNFHIESKVCMYITILTHSIWEIQTSFTYSYFGLKMMVKSGLEKIILKFLHAQAIFF